MDVMELKKAKSTQSSGVSHTTTCKNGKRVEPWKLSIAELWQETAKKLEQKKQRDKVHLQKIIERQGRCSRKFQHNCDECPISARCLEIKFYGASGQTSFSYSHLTPGMIKQADIGKLISEAAQNALHQILEEELLT